jgi:hypothetical protein
MENLSIVYGIISILAIIAGPIIAVRVQKKIDLATEARKRKLDLFKTLMATRAAVVSAEHVRALNMIELEFRDNKKIIDAWIEYHDHLNQQFTQETFQVWSEKSRDLLANLLREMGTSLGYQFDNVRIKKGAYLPQGLGVWELAGQAIRDGAVKILTGQSPIYVAPYQAPPQPPVGKADEPQA